MDENAEEFREEHKTKLMDLSWRIKYAKTTFLAAEAHINDVAKQHLKSPPDEATKVRVHEWRDRLHQAGAKLDTTDFLIQLQLEALRIQSPIDYDYFWDGAVELCCRLGKEKDRLWIGDDPSIMSNLYGQWDGHPAVCLQLLDALKDCVEEVFPFLSVFRPGNLDAEETAALAVELMALEGK